MFLTARDFSPEWTKSEVIESFFFERRANYQGAEMYFKEIKNLIQELLVQQEENLFHRFQLGLHN